MNDTMGCFLMTNLWTCLLDAELQYVGYLLFSLAHLYDLSWHEEPRLFYRLYHDIHRLCFNF